MKSNSVAHSARIALLVSGSVGLIAGVLAWVQVQRERESISTIWIDERMHWPIKSRGLPDKRSPSVMDRIGKESSSDLAGFGA